MNKKGLYRSSFEKDSCGIGFIAQLEGIASHTIIKDSLRMLSNMKHRGGHGYEENSGDGAGILIHIPHEFLISKKAGLSFSLPKKGKYGLGMIFFPQNSSDRLRCKEIIQTACEELHLSILGYRIVPVNAKDLGSTSKSKEPWMEQVFIKAPNKVLSSSELERKLYLLRKLISYKVKNFLGSQKTRRIQEDFLFTSLSSLTVIYKGQLTTQQLSSYFPDLTETETCSALALVHSRFSTNTFPSWKLAQPFRFLAHNGEINTIKGNINWIKSKETLLESSLFSPEEIKLLIPIIEEGGSDSANLDNVIELLYHSGRSLAQVMMMLIPEAWEKNPFMEDSKKAFYEYHDCITEAWDGPASIGFTDGKIIGAILDRNGLRPARYSLTFDNRLIMASEAGSLPLDPGIIKFKGRLQPGKMLIADLERGRIIDDEEIKKEISNIHPYRSWLNKNKIRFKELPIPKIPIEVFNTKKLRQYQLAFGFSREEIDQILMPMILDKKEAISSMGNDTPLAILSDQPQNLSNYFKQLFAQVTNPPIDSIRENLVMSISSNLGGYGGLLSTTEKHCKQIQIDQPIFTDQDILKLRYFNHPDFKTTTIDILFPANKTQNALEKSVQSICIKAEEAVLQGYNILILSDKNLNESEAPIPSLLITGAVHHHLVNKKIRISTSLIIESGDIRDVHQISTHLAFGASAVYPYLVFATLYSKHKEDKILQERKLEVLINNYIQAASNGLLKIFSKMGVSTLGSYHGAQTFEILGLHTSLVEKCFTGTESRLGGLHYEQIAKESLQKHQVAFSEKIFSVSQLPEGGLYQWKRRGEEHLFNPETIHLLQFSTATKDYNLFKKYSDKMNRWNAKNIVLRNLIDFKLTKNPIPISEVESIEKILPRFSTGAMSFGSLSHEAHTTLAIAMNRIGAKSNSGEGGEDESRYPIKPNGDWERSAIKQVASARFGVDSFYLSNAIELQIKMAQGAKPGEGGQLPGDKVDEWIGRVRNATPGVGLISPPPHHDIYSIEDLAQLIFDLKNANPIADISVKLVSEAGVGTIAAGVVKTKADKIIIAGHDGGTGASPISSIHHAGMPWEIGLAETHQTLVKNQLRDRVTLQTDGQIRTGKDLAIATLLGAEEWGIATAALVATGCIMMRKCHLNTCPVGIATQDADLRKNYTGDPDQVIQLFRFMAEELREIMAELGFRTLHEMVGQSQHLKKMEDLVHWKYKTLDLSTLFYKPQNLSKGGLFNQVRFEDRILKHQMEQVLDRKIIEASYNSLEPSEPFFKEFPINNTDRSVGALLSNQISIRYGKKGLPKNTFHLKFTGSAGQSFGCFSAKGLLLELEGEANDYVGKGLSGATLIVYPSKKSKFLASENIIIGNVALYGAISGEVFISGIAGERFAVRNSGAIAVVESVGDHGCEYMTGGRVIILGKTGRNFAAGMSGGIAYVFDSDKKFNQNCNMDMVEIEAFNLEDIHFLKTYILKHIDYTKSQLATLIYENWEITLESFKKVMPKDYKQVLAKNAYSKPLETMTYVG